MMRSLLLSAALTLAVPVYAMQSVQPPVARSVPARAIEARIDAHVAEHPKSKADPARAKSAKTKSSSDVVASVKPIAPRPTMRRQPKPPRTGKKTP
jgi:hypothetical protein